MRDELRALADHYGAYLEAFEAAEAGGPLADYEWGNLPARLSGCWLVYDQMFDEFAREIANTINQLVTAEKRLGAWEIAMTGLDPEEFHNALFEFVDPLATLALNLPAVIRDRVIFAAAHLMHQANQVQDMASSKYDLPDDRNIKRRDLEKHGSGWNATAGLLAALEKLAASADSDAETGSFRNKYHHRFPARVGLGITGLVTRHRDPETRHTSYAIGGSDPLSVATIRQFLRTQIVHAHEVSGAFKALVREFEAAITAWESEHGLAKGAS